MIVKREFPNHHKTQLLCGLLEDKNAGMYVIRLWGYCEARKEWKFDRIDARKLSAICAYDVQDAPTFWAAMLEAGFIEMEGDVLVVHEWGEYNRKLFASSTNGKLGGRPIESGSKPTGYENETDRLDGQNLNKTRSKGNSIVEYSDSTLAQVAQGEKAGNEGPKVEVNFSPGFLKFWRAYPNRKAKQRAWMVWKRRRLESIVEQIVRGVEEHKDCRQWIEGYVPYPEKWLNAGSWEDEIEDSERGAKENEPSVSHYGRSAGNGLDCVN